MNENSSALTAADVALLRRVFTQAMTDEDSDLDLMAKADELVRLFQEGVSSEEDLLARLQGGWIG